MSVIIAQNIHVLPQALKSLSNCRMSFSDDMILHKRWLCLTTMSIDQVNLSNITALKEYYELLVRRRKAAALDPLRRGWTCVVELPPHPVLTDGCLPSTTVICT